LIFLVDARLPPSLAEALRHAGCQAVHLVDVGLLAATDQQIWDEAISRSAVLVTKDRDFALRKAASNDGPRSCGSELEIPAIESLSSWHCAACHRS